MAMAAAEGEKFLKETGHEDETSEGPNTRSKKQMRKAVDVMLADKKKVVKENVEDKARYKEKLRMLFRIFDKNHDNKIDKYAISFGNL
jgi:Ca2+-binding EF-hand superfamily protein